MSDKNQSTDIQTASLGSHQICPSELADINETNEAASRNTGEKE